MYVSIASQHRVHLQSSTFVDEDSKIINICITHQTHAITYLKLTNQSALSAVRKVLWLD